VVDHAVGTIERVGVGWCTDGAGYPLRLAAYMVDQGCQLVKPSRMAIVRFLAGLNDSISGAPADQYRQFRIGHEVPQAPGRSAELATHGGLATYRGRVGVKVGD
jgi:hypothetical protein